MIFAMSSLAYANIYGEKQLVFIGVSFNSNSITLSQTPPEVINTEYIHILCCPALLQDIFPKLGIFYYTAQNLYKD